MEPGKTPLPARDQASKIAAAYRSIPLEDRGKKLHPLEEDVQNPDLDRAFDELVESSGTKQPADKMAVQFPDIVSTPIADEDDIEGASSHYECPECGHENPGRNQFCGKCGAAHGETVIAPARRITDEGSVALTVTSSSGIKHFHHHYHHTHYRSSPYLILSIAVLLAVMAWHAGWEYGFRASMTPPTTSPPAAKALPAYVPSGPETNSPPASTKAEDRELEASAAVQWNGPYAQVTGQTPYPNELQGFNFYSKHLAPLHSGVSERAEVVRVLGDGSTVVAGWRIIPTYTTKRGSVYNPPLGPLAEIILSPEGVIPMGAVKFPATFAHCHATVSEVNISFDVYSDSSGLEYWLHEEDSKWGRKGDLYRIVYGPSKRHSDHKRIC